MSCPLDEWRVELILTACLILTWSVWKYLTTPSNLPPGPIGIPIFGYLPFIGKKPHVTLAKMRKKYGDIIMFQMGQFPAVALNSFAVIKEALVKQGDAFSARTERTLHEMRKHPGIITNTTDSWSDFRRFSLSTLKDFGFGRSSLEPQLMEEIQRFIDLLAETKGKPTQIAVILNKSVVNVICTIISGRRMEYDHPVLNELLEMTKVQIASSGICRSRDAIPKFLRNKWAFNLLGQGYIIDSVLNMLGVLNHIVDRHDEKHVPGSQDNFIDSWLSEAEKESKKSKHITKDQLPSVLRDLFIAGSDTTANTLTWAFLYMAKYQDVQKKVQHEIDEVIGRERTPSMTDQKNMPYTDATLMEISRIATIVPLSVLHCTSKDAILEGYFIPKNTVVIPNIWSVHHDPDLFPEPEEFKPERFLTDNQQIKKMEELIPFSIGRRQCMGESLAKMELFLYFTAVLQQFQLVKEDGVELNFDYDFAVISVPKLQNLCAVPR